jgi:hypothetical protein
LADASLRDERQAVVQTIADEYKNAIGKFVLNLGNLLYPIYEAQAQLIGNLTLNDACQLDAAVDACVSLRKDFSVKISN